ncbi:hypothetical protein BTA51_09355 [Hahella sp. CCB-MM4]|uniref:GPW/gp25 family protein n=1 Tax=Hahella sp. (strain CCB-MM4) TaxID=1926491 RepID=UPI000B9BAD40|nr:GPW/gp25 family protein [Hahella sp. CCB-MM4]OZG73976.1 hypothetical protein BTA51_09355 [Hahella sp. CCB-MM4]
MDKNFLGNGVNYPFSFSKGIVKSSEGDDLIAQSIMQILSTRKGERVMRPDYGCGINELVFEANNTALATQFEFLVQDAIGKFEPRVELTSVRVEKDAHNGNQLNICLEYIVKAVNSSRNLVYPFYLQGTSS